MADIARVQCIWRGVPGLPGYTNLFLRTPVTSVAAIASLWTNMSNEIPSNITVEIPGTGDVYDEATGELTGVWTAAGGTTFTGSGQQSHAGPSGACINWITGGINRGHKVRGRTFMVPLSLTAYDVDGSLIPAKQSLIQISADTMLASLGPQFVVWSRPVNKLGGAAFAVSSARVPDLAVVLRSRRD